MKVIMTSIRLYNKQNNENHEHSLPPITYPTPLYPLELPDRAHSHSPAAQQTVYEYPISVFHFNQTSSSKF